MPYTVYIVIAKLNGVIMYRTHYSLLLVLLLYTASGLGMKTLVNPANDNQTNWVDFKADYHKIDQEFYEVITAPSLDPLRVFCKKCEQAYNQVSAKFNGNPSEDPRCDIILSSAGDAAHYYCWWDNFINNEFMDTKLYNSKGTTPYFVPKLIVEQDSKNRIADNSTARLEVVLSYMKPHKNKENTLEYSARIYALTCKNEKAYKYLCTFTPTAPLEKPHTVDNPQNDTDIKDEGNGSLIDNHKPTPKKISFKPISLIIMLACCTVCAVGAKKWYDWYHTQASHQKDELEEKTIVA